MSESPATPQKRISRKPLKKPQDLQDKNKIEHEQINKFISWYKQMIDDERHNIGLYLADDAILEYFGRTIKSRKKVSIFLQHDMHCSRHDFISVQSIDKIQSHRDRASRIEEHNLPANTKTDRKRRILRSTCPCRSPEWAEGCQSPEERKKLRPNNEDSINIDNNHSSLCRRNYLKRNFDAEDCTDLNSKGDGVLDRRVRRKYMPFTPPNCEVGQGDCIPSTSGTDSDRSHDTLNAQLTKLYVECNGFIQFTRTRNKRSTDSMKWERKCKVQISFSEDPLNEYIIWSVHYSDESKIRRNLLPAFEKVAMEEGMKANSNLLDDDDSA